MFFTAYLNRWHLAGNRRCLRAGDGACPQVQGPQIGEHPSQVVRVDLLDLLVLAEAEGPVSSFGYIQFGEEAGLPTVDGIPPTDACLEADELAGRE